MSSGNTYGLGEISHFGAFQRVGGKAGGFINKKFFHPSTLRNQEKLWLAMTADERERKKQDELEKRREEERQVEELRKQMYLSGQGKATDISAVIKDQIKESLTPSNRAEKKDLLDEEKRRRDMVKGERSHREAIEEGAEFSSGEEEDEDADRELARSRYEEDVFVRGHTSVWGSWYSEEKKWGFACCKVRDFNAECPLAPEDKEEEEEDEKKPSKAHRGRKRRRRGNRGGEENFEAGEEEAPSIKGGLQGAAASASAVKSTDPASLIDQRMLEAAEKRQEKRREEERQKEEIKKSGYLADLLCDPTA